MIDFIDKILNENISPCYPVINEKHYNEVKCYIFGSFAAVNEIFCFGISKIILECLEIEPSPLIPKTCKLSQIENVHVEIIKKLVELKRLIFNNGIPSQHTFLQEHTILIAEFIVVHVTYNL